MKVSSSIEEFTELLASGFEYVSDYEGRKVLRKRKRWTLSRMKEYRSLARNQ